MASWSAGSLSEGVRYEPSDAFMRPQGGAGPDQAECDCGKAMAAWVRLRTPSDLKIAVM